MMKNDAQVAVKDEFRRWAASEKLQLPTTGNEAFRFYLNLESKHSRLLSFRSSGDRWQTVHSWLIRAGPAG
jgi:hypothetical protein